MNSDMETPSFISQQDTVCYDYLVVVGVALALITLLVCLLVYAVLKSSYEEGSRLKEETEKRRRNEEVIDSLLSASRSHRAEIEALKAENQKALDDANKSSTEMVALYIKHLDELRKERDEARQELSDRKTKDDGLTSRLHASILERKKLESQLADRDAELDELKNLLTQAQEYMQRTQSTFEADDEQTQQEALALITERLMAEHDEALKATTKKLKAAHQKELDKMSMRLKRATDDAALRDEEIRSLRQACKDLEEKSRSRLDEVD